MEPTPKAELARAFDRLAEVIRQSSIAAQARPGAPLPTPPRRAA